MPDLNIMPAPVGTAAKDRIRAALTSEDTFATTMLLLAADLLPAGFMEWHPRTILAELERATGVDVPQLNYDRLMAAVCIKQTDLFEANVGCFVRLCNVMAGTPLDADVFDPADSVECAWGITEKLLLDPPDDDEPFSDEVRGYVGQVLKWEGYVTPPDVLRIALDGDFSEHVRYNFGDDPALSDSIFQGQRAKATEVTQVIKDNLLELLEQVEALPLSEGSTAELRERITRAVGAGR